jgi:MOSC domain-containing protein YiiM
LTTRGVALNHLVGRNFRVGAVTLTGIRLCEPCEHMEALSGVAGVKSALLHRGGLRAEIVSGGEIRVGDVIEEV